MVVTRCRTRAALLRKCKQLSPIQWQQNTWLKLQCHVSEKYWSTLKEGNSRVDDYLSVWHGLCLKRSAPPPTSIQSLTPSSRAWLLQYQWGSCAIPLDPTKAVAEKSNQKTRLLAGWKKTCTIPGWNPQNCSQSWRDSLSPRHPVWARTGFRPRALMLPPEGGDEDMMDYMQHLVWLAPWLMKR